MSKPKKEPRVVTVDVIDFVTDDVRVAEKVQKALGVNPETTGSGMYFNRKYIFKGVKDKALEVLKK
jgi:hypothetical protein